MTFHKLSKLKKGDKVAIVSPSFAAPAVWPEVYELGLSRLRDVFGLIPVEYPTTKKLNASGQDRAKDLISAFENKEIKAVISTLGGDDEVTYIKNLPKEPFLNNPKPFFGYSDTTHFQNFLWMNGIPSFYGGNLFTQFAMQGRMDEMTKKYLDIAIFKDIETILDFSDYYNDEGLSWADLDNLNKIRKYEKNSDWYWDGDKSTEGILWGGCLESLDEILRHNIEIPTLEQFSNIVFMFETSEEIPSSDYVFRVLRGFGERSFFDKIKAVLVGRPKTWEFDNQKNSEEKDNYKRKQIETVIKAVRKYNSSCPIIQNLDFGHTDPQICMPIGKRVRINSTKKEIYAEF